MKKIVEVDNEGLEGLIGVNVDFWCFNYIYSGKLMGVNDDCVMLEDAKVVYETGELNQRGFKDAQEFFGKRYIMKHAIESYGVSK